MDFQPRGKVLFSDHGSSSSQPNPLRRLLNLVTKTEDRFKPTKFLIIALHGWIPTKMLRAVIGQSNVTSNLIANNLEEALLEVNSASVIMKFPLEAEGTVAERLQKHLQQIKSNDTVCAKLLENDVAVVFIAHSQGVPVSTFLIEDLYQSGHLKDLSRVYLIGLAGIMEGPYKPIRQHPAVKYMEGRPAKELFHFGRKTTKLKSDLDRSLQWLLENGGQISLFASWMDQVVPLNSALLCSFAAHPNLLRYIFIPDTIDEETLPIVMLAQICIDLLHDPKHCSLGSYILSSISQSLVANMYVGTAHSAIAMSNKCFQVMSKHLGESSPTSRKIGSNSIEGLDNVDEDFLPWFLNDLKRLNLPYVKRNCDILTMMVSEWKPTKSEWILLSKKLRPLWDRSKL